VETAGPEWAVLTWNIQGAKRTDLGRVASVIAAEQPDVVVLQEARRPQAERLAGDLGMAHVWNEKHHPFRPFFPSRAEGAAILSPHTLRETGHVRVSDTTRKRSYRRRIVQWAVVERSNRSAARVFNAHLSPHDMDDRRRIEAQRIAEIAASFGGRPPTIVAGDLNDAGTPVIVAILPGIEALDPPPTNPSERPTQALDHVLVPAEATQVSVSAPGGGKVWAELSDHLPLTVRFVLDPAPGGLAP
jgi:endonuclease/exonuclease/phosphatase family metal-dependent hydrolase